MFLKFGIIILTIPNFIMQFDVVSSENRFLQLQLSVFQTTPQDFLELLLNFKALILKILSFLLFFYDLIEPLVYFAQ